MAALTEDERAELERLRRLAAGADLATGAGVAGSPPASCSWCPCSWRASP